MTLDQITAAEHLGGRAIRAIRPFVDKGADRDALNRAEYILAEVRHFAICWNETRQQEDDKLINADEATRQRQDVIQRLTSYCAPSRL